MPPTVKNISTKEEFRSLFLRHGLRMQYEIETNPVGEIINVSGPDNLFSIGDSFRIVHEHNELAKVMHNKERLSLVTQIFAEMTPYKFEFIVVLIP